MIGFPKVVDTTEELHLLCRDGLISDISCLQHNIVQVLFKCKIFRQRGMPVVGRGSKPGYTWSLAEPG